MSNGTPADDEPVSGVAGGDPRTPFMSPTPHFSERSAATVDEEPTGGIWGGSGVSLGDDWDVP